jgi:predicted permease
MTMTGMPIVLDLRYALRGLRRSPAVAAVAVLSLAVGIGASTAIFSVSNAVILRSLPVCDPDTLVLLRYVSAKGNVFDSFSYSDYLAFRDTAGALTGLAALTDAEVNLASDEATERVAAQLVSGNYFDLLGVSARTGRLIAPSDDLRPGAHPVVVISHGLWQRRFGSAPDVAGRQVQINGRAYTILGVATESFHGTDQGHETQVYIPLMMANEVMTGRKEPFPQWDDWLQCIGRRDAKVPLARAESILDARFEQLPLAHRKTTFESSQRHGETGNRARLVVADGRQGYDNLRFGYERPLAILLGLVALLLAVTCTNVANILLARAAGRRKETAIRIALGGGAWSVIRQLLAEGLLLAGAGAAAGLVLSIWISDLLVRTTSIENAHIDVRPDSTVIAFLLGVTVLTTVVFGMAPAWATLRLAVAPALKSGGGSGTRRGILGAALVVAQVCLSVTLLAGAGLLVRSLRNLETISTGFRADHVVVASLNPGANRYTPEQSRALFTTLMEQAESISGVQNASAALVSPVSGVLWMFSVEVPGYTPAPGQVPMAYYNAVGPGYFASVGAILKRGREFTRIDRAGAPPVAVVNEEFVRKFCSGRDAVGQRIRSGGKSLEIVGVVRDSIYRDLRESKTAVFYVPLLQTSQRSATLVLRAAGDLARASAHLAALARRIDPTVPLFGMRTLEAQIAGTLSPERMLALVSSLFAIFAVVLAMIGLYGVLAYAVAQRSREIGIRMALGAAPGQVVGAVVRDAIRIVAIGLVLGVPLSLGASRWIATSLYGLQTGDPLTYVSIIAVLAVASLAAAYVPSRRAAQVDPMSVLRE